jgi:predicted ribosomally synthesized peptide with SipW-like signal peptide
MLRLAKSLLTILAVAAVAVGATGAYFNDEATISGMSFATGTLQITDASPDWSKTVTFTNLKPGDWNRKWVTIQNTGSLDVDYLTVNAVNVVDPSGLLGQVKISVSGAVAPADSAFFTDDWGAGSKVLPWMTNVNILDAPSYYRIPAGVIHPGESYTLNFDFTVPTTLGNTYQGQSSSFDMVFNAEQTH